METSQKLTETQLIEHQLSMIRNYVLEHGLRPELIGAYFSAGIAAAAVLRDLAVGS